MVRVARLCLLTFLLCCRHQLYAGQFHAATDTTLKGKVEYGVASYYSDKFIGKKTANGDIFSQDKMTAAHNSLPLGTYVEVTNLRNNKKVRVKVNDRLNKRNKRLIDLSKSAANKLGFVRAGLTRVKIVTID